MQNSGTIIVPANLGAQSLTLDCNFINFGTIDAETNSVLNVLYGSSGEVLYGDDQPAPMFESGTIFDGPGTVDLTSGGPIDCGGNLTVNGTLDFNSDQQGNVIWTGSGLLSWSSGGFTESTFAPGFRVKISGTGAKTITGTCTNQGSVCWLGGGSVSFPNSNAFFNGGLFQVTTDGVWSGMNLQNQSSGTFRQLAGSFSLQSFTNSGTVDLKSGTLNVAGAFLSGSNSTYQVTLGGSTAGSGFNQLNAQSVTLNGSLQVTLTNGFLPSSGNSFVIVSDSSQSGAFSSTSLPAVGNGATMDVRYLPTSLVLDVVPAFFGLTNAAYTNGSFQFSLNGNAASAYDIQASTNLFDWVTIGTNSPFTGSVNFMDTNAANSSRRFYRARIFP